MLRKNTAPQNKQEIKKHNQNRSIILIPLALSISIIIHFNNKNFIYNNVYIILAMYALFIILLYISKKLQKKSILMILASFLIGFYISNIQTKENSLLITDNIKDNIYIFITGKILKIKKLKNNQSMLLLENHSNSKNLKLKNVKIYTYNLPKDIYTSDIINTKILLFKTKKANDILSQRFQRYNLIYNISGTGNSISTIKKIYEGDVFIRFFDKIRQDCYERYHEIFHNDKNAANITSSLIIGYRTTLSNDLNEKIKKTGLSHIFAISGLHFNIVIALSFMIINKILSIFRCISLNFNTIKITAFITIFLSTLFIMISGHPISAQRAYWMIIYYLISILINRKTNSIYCFSIVMFAMLIANPTNIFDIGFQLSFLSTFIILSIVNKKNVYNKENNFKKIRKVVNYIIDIAKISTIINIGITPLIAYHFQYLSLIGILANILIIPLISFIIMPTIVLLTIAMMFKDPIFLTCIAKKSIALMIYIIDLLSDIKFASIDTNIIDGYSALFITLGIIFFLSWKGQIRYNAILLFLPCFYSYKTQLNYNNMNIFLSDNNFAIRENNLLYIYKEKHKYSKEEKNWLHINQQKKFIPISDKNRSIKCDYIKCVYDKKSIIILDDDFKIDKRYLENFDNIHHVNIENKRLIN
ncbi:ComEC/Rec2 family competence protein [Anaplasmataceae bacterium AB001_6]|nr:ComEC/Rec2 family competence protein [Anaplasmataceae bacterium AB001_6]